MTSARARSPAIPRPPVPRAIPTTSSRRSTCAARRGRCRAGGQPTPDFTWQGGRAPCPAPSTRRRRRRARHLRRPRRSRSRRRGQRLGDDHHHVGGRHQRLGPRRVPPRRRHAERSPAPRARAVPTDERAGRARAPRARRVRHPRPQLRGGRHASPARRRSTPAAAGDTVAGAQRGLRRPTAAIATRSTRRRSRTASRPTFGRDGSYRAARRARQLAHRAAPRAAEALHHLGPDGPGRRAHGLRDARGLQPPLAAAGRARRPEEGADVGGGHVYKSTDAGETFRDVSGNLPDIPADFALVRNGQLVVATDLGVFISADTDGGAYEPLGDGPAERCRCSRSSSSPRRAPRARHAHRGDAGPRRVPLRVRRAGQAPAATCAGGQPAPPTTPGRRARHDAGHPVHASAPAGRRRRDRLHGEPALTSASARAPGAGCVSAFTRRVARPVTVDVFQRLARAGACSASGSSRASPAARAASRWNGRANRRGPDGRRRLLLRALHAARGERRRRHAADRAAALGRALVAPAGPLRPRGLLDRCARSSCVRPVFGGPTRRALGISVRLDAPARVTVTVRRGSRVVKRFPAVQRSGERTDRLRCARAGCARRLPRDDRGPCAAASGSSRHAHVEAALATSTSRSRARR